MAPSIVTKTGDDGKTFLLGGVRVAKNNIIVKTYGEIDELNSVIGITINFISVNKELLETIQNQLFEIGSIIANPSKIIDQKKSLAINSYINTLEGHIKNIENQLPELKNFVLPGGTKGSSFLHLARTVCRRVERSLLDLMEVEFPYKNILIYFNRLSDLFFVLARSDNIHNNNKEIIWRTQIKTGL